ncbi:MAG: AMP-binding protein, partial [Bauldia sp.]|nr:AMP-binding protein [Bauldia sp.]
MTETVHPVTPEWAERAFINRAKYDEMYRRSVTDPDGFWAEQAERLDWIKPFTKVKNTSFKAPDVSIKWFEDGELNVAANCIDRHLATRGDQTAILWEPDDPATPGRTITYRELYENVCKLANVLKSHGVKKGDRVTIYMPMIPEVAFAMLACARIGAMHSVVFAGFSAEALAGRIEDCRSGYVITADEGRRGGRTVPLKANTDEAITIAEREGAKVEHVIVVQHTGGAVTMQDGRDVWYHEAVAAASADCPAEPMNAEDPLFILYTS